MPVRHRSYSHSGAKTIRVRECIERKGAPPAPSPPALALGINLRILSQYGVGDGKLIFKLHRAEVMIGRLGKVSSAMACAAIVRMQDGEAVLRKKCIEKEAI